MYSFMLKTRLDRAALVCSGFNLCSFSISSKQLHERAAAVCLRIVASLAVFPFQTHPGSDSNQRRLVSSCGWPSR